MHRPLYINREIRIMQRWEGERERKNKIKRTKEIFCYHWMVTEADFSTAHFLVIHCVALSTVIEVKIITWILWNQRVCYCYTWVISGLTGSYRPSSLESKSDTSLENTNFRLQLQSTTHQIRHAHHVSLKHYWILLRDVQDSSFNNNIFTCFIRSFTTYILGYQDLTPWPYIPASQLNYNSIYHTTHLLYIGISITNTLFLSILIRPTGHLRFFFLFFYFTLVPSCHHFSFIFILNHIHSYILPLPFILLSHCPPNTYFWVNIPKPLVQNLVPPNLSSFTPKYMAPFFFATYGKNPLFVVPPNPLQLID
jgi:hypothetical protein